MLSFKSNDEMLRAFLGDHIKNITVIPSEYNIFFESMFEFNRSDLDSVGFPQKKQSIEAAFFEVFKHCGKPNFQSIFLPATKMNRTDLPACEPVMNKFVTISMNDCGHELILFNILGSFVQHNVLKSLAGEIEREMTPQDRSSILRQRRLWYEIKVTMIRYFAYNWFERHQHTGGCVTKKYILDALNESMEIIGREVENVRKGYTGVDGTLKYLCGGWGFATFYGQVNFNEEYFLDVFKKVGCTEYSW